MELLRGEHVLLREMEESDAEQVVAWRRRPDSWRWLYHWDPLTPETHVRWMRGARQAGDLLFVFDTPGGEPVGAASVYGFGDPRRDRTGQFGRFVSARSPAQPVPLLEAVCLIHRVAIEVLGLRRMIAEVAPGNERAHRMLRFLGYVDEGRLRQHYRHPDGHLDDQIPLGLFPQEFAARRPEMDKVLYRGAPAPALAGERAARLRERLLGAAP